MPSGEDHGWKRLAAAAGAVLVAGLVLFPLLGAPGEPERAAFHGLMLPEALPEDPLRARHPAARWLCGRMGAGLVRRGAGGEWEPESFVASLETRETLLFRLRADAKLPDGGPVSAWRVSSYLGLIWDRLALDERTAGLSRTVAGEGEALSFRGSPAHEGLAGALKQLLPGIFEGEPERRVEIIVRARDAGAEGSWASVLGMEAGRQKNADANSPARHLFLGIDSVEAREGACVIGTGDHAGAVLRALSLPLFSRSDAKGVGLRERFLASVPVAAGRPGEGEAHFTIDPPPGAERIGTGCGVLVVALVNVRRGPMSGRERRRALLSGRGDLAGFSIKILCPAGDAPAVEESRRLQGRWLARLAAVRVSALAGEGYDASLGRRDFDVLVGTVPADWFEDPYPFWHSRGARNASGHTAAEVDSLIARLAAAVSAGERRSLAGAIRERLTADALVEVLREAELSVCGRPWILRSIREALRLR